MPAGDFCATSWRVHPTAAIAASKIASTAGGRSTAASGRRSTAGAASRLSAVSADGSAIVAESEPEGEGGSAGKGKEDKRAKSETGGSELVSGDEDVGAPLIAADAARIPGVESTPGIPALAAAGLAAGGEGGGLALGEWGYAVAGRAARAVGGAGRVVAAALPPESAVLLTACVVGLLTGASVSLFNEAVHAIRDTVWQGVPPEGGSTWLRSQSVAATWHLHIFVPLAGGVVVGILNTAMAAAVTLGTGNSLGPEGPSVEIGASVGKGAGKVVQGGRERTIALVAAGSAAGISAGFNAAVAGCFFALESVLRSSVSSAPASLTTAMVLLSSVLAAVVSQQILGSDPAVQIPLYEFRSPAELPLYLLLGLCCGGVSIALTRSARLATDAFDRLLLLSPLPPALLPALGGLSVGVISLAYPEVLYWGFQNINDLLGSRPLASGLSPPAGRPQGACHGHLLRIRLASLPPHCLLTASSLPPHCLLTASSLPPHCLLTASSLPPHCLLTASSLPPHCLLTASSLPPHCLLTASSLLPHCLLTASSLPPHCLLTASSLPPHCLLTASALPPHCLVFFTSTLSLPPPQVDFLLQLVALKVLATAICRGSGLVGGFYAPSLFIGAALGQAYGRLASDVLVAVDPEYNLQWIQVAAPQAYAMHGVEQHGMATTSAGVWMVPPTLMNHAPL
ncbi:unnamed protein product [Closterium sp. NIES-65]|nr:unnamed protein product [Closterium sp. NIES-65]